MARMPPAAIAAARAPTRSGSVLATAYPSPATIPQARTTMAHIPPSFAGDHPPSTNAADGASACGMFDIQTAAMNEALNVSPAHRRLPTRRRSPGGYRLNPRHRSGPHVSDNTNRRVPRMSSRILVVSVTNIRVRGRSHFEACWRRRRRVDEDCGVRARCRGVPLDLLETVNDGGGQRPRNLGRGGSTWGR